LNDPNENSVIIFIRLTQTMSVTDGLM